MRFKEFLMMEDKLPPWKLKPAELTHEQMVEWIQENAMSFVNRHNRIYRGVKSPDAEGLYNAAQLRRRSANTQNYYNTWVNNHHSWDKYPRRDSSFICTTYRGTAEMYGEPYIVIPQDHSPIGICPASDFWFSFKEISKMSGLLGMDAFMIFTSALTDLANIAGNREDDWDILSACLHKVDAELLSKHLSTWTNKTARDIGLKFLTYMEQNHLESAYVAYEKLLDPDTHGFEVKKASEFDAVGDNEVWMSGGILLLAEKTWVKIQKDLGL